MAVNIGPRIGIEGETEFRRQIYSIIQDTRTLKSEFKAIASDSGGNPFQKAAEQAKILGDAIESQQKRIAELQKGYSEAVNKWGADDAKTQKWKQAIADATTELHKFQTQLKEIPSAVEIIGQKWEDVGKKIKGAGDHITAAGRAIMPVSAAASGALVGATKSYIDFESAMTGVKKTNDELVDSNGKVIISYDDLADSIKRMSTETASSKTEIAGVMEIAGQLGVGTEHLEEFTETMIRLGDSTNLTAEEAATMIAQYANITGMPLNNVSKLGAAIVDLGNNYATTEQDIMSMAMRLAGAGAQIGLSEGEVLGFSTALSSVGIEAEMGGSAFSKAMIKMQMAAETGFEPMLELTQKTGLSLRDMELMASNDTKGFTSLADSLGMTKTELKATMTAASNLNDFASVANMTTEDFVRLYRTDAPAALQAFISGLGDVEGHGQTTIAMLQDMGFTEVRLRDTLTRLANSGDLVTNAIKTGNEAWKENSALIEESEKRYGTTESKISQTKERLTNLGIEIGERLLPYVERALNFADRMIAAWDKLSTGEQDAIVHTVALVAAAGPVLTTGGKVISSIGSIVQTGGSLIKGIGSVVKVVGTVGPAVSNIGSIVGGVVPAISTAIGGIGTFLTGTLVPAIGGVVAAVGSAIAAALPVIAIIAAVVGAGVLLYKNWDTIKELAGQLGEAISGAWNTVKEKTAQAWDNLKTKTSEVWESCKNTISGAWDAIREKTSSITDSIRDGVSNAWDAISNKTSEIWDNCKTKIHDTWENIKEKTSSVTENVKTFVSDAWENIKEKTHDTWENIKSKTSETWSNVKDTMTDLADQARNTVSEAVSSLRDTVSEKWENIKAETAEKWDNIKTSVVEAAHNLKEKAVEKFSELKDKVGEKFHEIVDKAKTWGSDMMENFKNGISGAIDKVKNVASKVGSAVRDFLGFSEPKKGPLSNFHTFAPDMMELFAKGIKDNEGIVAKQLQSSLNFENAITMGHGYIPEAGSTSNVMTVGDTVINVYAQPGQNTNELAEAIDQRLNAKYASMRAVFS